MNVESRGGPRGQWDNTYGYQNTTRACHPPDSSSLVGRQPTTRLESGSVCACGGCCETNGTRSRIQPRAAVSFSLTHASVLALSRQQGGFCPLVGVVMAQRLPVPKGGVAVAAICCRSRSEMVRCLLPFCVFLPFQRPTGKETTAT